MRLTKRRMVLLAPVIVFATVAAIVEASNVADPGLHPASRGGWDERSLDAAVGQIRSDISEATDPAEIERLQNSLAGVLEFQRTAEIGERLNAGLYDGEGEKERLLADLDEGMRKLEEHAGDRWQLAIVGPDNVTVITRENASLLESLQ